MMLHVGAVAAADLPLYSAVVADLRRADVPVQELSGSGYAAVSLAAGRIVAIAFSRDGPDLLWSNPDLSNTERLRGAPQELIGGLGGDRLWLGPEVDYFWKGEPDWHGFKNYATQTEVDPGQYAFEPSPAGTVTLRSRGVVNSYRENRARIVFDIRRSVRMADPPLSREDPLMRNVDYVGIETSNLLEIDRASKVGRIDLWHLLQAPVGSILIVPLNATASASDRKPLSYGLAGGWVERLQYIAWRFGGRARAKFGLPARALTGRAGLLRELDKGYWCLIIREFNADPKSSYADHPYGVPRDDQVLQGWDGFGFGELEYHSPVLEARGEAGTLNDSDRIWAFGGSAGAIVILASRLLGVDASPLMKGESL